MSTAATDERRRLAEELADVGPDADTLCEGWTARDLAAHIVLRDSRPDAAVGVIVSALSGHTDSVQSKIVTRDWDELVERIRDGAPIWSPTRIGVVDRVVNTIEFFVHLEDVRRAQPDWEPRELDDGLADDLVASLGRAAKLMARKAPTGVTLVPDRGEAIVANEGDPMVTVSGPVGELVLFLYGRRDHAMVEYAGPDESVVLLQGSTFGI